MTHTQSKSKEKKRYFRMLAILLIPVIALILGAAAPELWAGNYDDDDEEEIPFDVAELFFELNNTDGDLGIHALVDGDAWKYLEIEDTRDRKMLNIIVRGRLRRQGLTELFFESAEPTFDELSPQKFFRRFPEGEYDIEGITIEGEERESEVWLSHVLPAPVDGITLNGGNIINLEAVDCDVENTVPSVTVSEEGTVTISWAPVTMSHPDLGVELPVAVTIHNYEVVVEVELEVNGEEFASVFSALLPPGETSMTIPEEFIDLGEEFKYEVLAREKSYNQTAVESCFVLE